MEKSSKRKFNIVDIIIIVIIVCAIGVGIKLLKGSSAGSSSSNEVICFEFLAQEVRYEGANKVTVGDKVYNSTNSAYIGVVKDVEVTPFYVSVFDPSKGQYVQVELEDKCNIKIVVESNGYETEKSFFFEGHELRAGNEFFLKGKGYAFEGHVVKVDV